MSKLLLDPMPTVPVGEAAYGTIAFTNNGSNRTTVQTPFSNQVTAGAPIRSGRLAQHRINRGIRLSATTVAANATVTGATDSINNVRVADRVPGTLVNGKRTGRVRRLAQGAIATFGTLVGGTGYTNGSYPNTPLTHVTPTASNVTIGGAAADITVAGGIVTVCTLVAARNGETYSVGDILTAQAGRLGAGTGFTITVAAVTNG